MAFIRVKLKNNKSKGRISWRALEKTHINQNRWERTKVEYGISKIIQKKSQNANFSSTNLYWILTMPQALGNYLWSLSGSLQTSRKEDKQQKQRRKYEGQKITLHPSKYRPCTLTVLTLARKHGYYASASQTEPQQKPDNRNILFQYKIIT